MASDKKRSFGWLAVLTVMTALATVAAVALLVNIFERKQEARAPFTKVVEVTEVNIDYREARGHAHMLADQEVTKRVTDVQQAGACLHCHASIIPTYRRIGLEEMGEDASPAVLAKDFNMDAVMAGF
jgi:hypothetical protein